MANDDYKDVYAREIVTTRVFDAPRELVWRAWSEPENVKNWWGPNGFTNTFHEFDFREGGMWRFIMHGPDGTDYPNENMFVEIQKPSRIVIDHVSAPRFRLTATFDDFGGKTKLTFRQLFETAELRDKIAFIAGPANEQNMDKIAAVLKAMV